jgi:pimeloyl-ACP methyl ester carboxylesterase
LGGKIALTYFARRNLSHLLILDSNPGPQPDAKASDKTLEVLSLLEKTHFPFRTHQDFCAAMESQGLSRGVAQWLGMNLVHRPDGYHFGPELAAMRALLEDYLEKDLWPAINPPPANRRIGFLLGDRSPTCGPEARHRLEALSRYDPDFSLEVLPGAGHWVHVDDPEGTFRFIVRVLKGAA